METSLPFPARSHAVTYSPIEYSQLNNLPVRSHHHSGINQEHLTHISLPTCFVSMIMRQGHLLNILLIVDPPPRINSLSHHYIFDDRSTCSDNIFVFARRFLILLHCKRDKIVWLKHLDCSWQKFSNILFDKELLHWRFFTDLTTKALSYI